jgi:hypothetical protein
MKRVQLRDTKLKAAWDKREQDFADLWDTREIEFKKLAESASRTVSTTTKLRFSVNGNGEVKELEGPAALDRLASLGIRSGNTSSPRDSPRGSPRSARALKPGKGGSGGGGSGLLASVTASPFGLRVGGSNAGTKNPLGLPLDECASSAGIEPTTADAASALLARHNDTVSKAKARPQWDFDNVLA